MTQSEIKSKFRKVYGTSKNFMTPNVIRYGKQGKYLYELSQGRDFKNGYIFGVTVIDVDENRHHDLSKCLHNKEKAENYIKSLK